MQKSKRETGRISVVKSDRGFGFVKRDCGSELFFHVSEMGVPRHEFDARLIERPVSFEIGTDDRTGKPQAIAIRFEG